MPKWQYKLHEMYGQQVSARVFRINHNQHLLWLFRNEVDNF